MKSFIQYVVAAPVFVSMAVAMAADTPAPVSSSITLYKSTTWKTEIDYFVVRQGAHAELHPCGSAVFSGSASDSQQIASFFTSSCQAAWDTSTYSTPTYVGFQTKNYLMGSNNLPSSLFFTVSYSQLSSSGSVATSGLQTFTFVLDATDLPQTVISEEGTNVSYQDSENPTWSSYKQTFSYVGSTTVALPPITN